MKAVVFLTKFIRAIKQNAKKVMFCLFLVSVLLMSGCFPSFQNSDQTINMEPRQITLSTKMDTTKVVEEVKSAVVGISCNLYNGQSVGSGVAVAENGYILTNQHVISGAKNIKVYFADKTDASANVIWQDASMDIAVIKTNRNMPYLECGDSSNVLAGEDVIAIGTPLTLDFKHTVTKGIVSATNRTLQIENSNGNVSYMQNLIQHDASINPGNSGGPLINSKGQIIGINTLKATEAEGLGFAIPISVGKQVIEKLSADENWESAYMGVFGFDSEIAMHKGEKLAISKGVFVSEIDPQTQQYLDGLQRGDIIVAINNKKINTVLDLRLELYKYSCNDVISVEIIRENQNKVLSCTLCCRQ